MRCIESTTNVNAARSIQKEGDKTMAHSPLYIVTSIFSQEQPSFESGQFPTITGVQSKTKLVPYALQRLFSDGATSFESGLLHH
jgi:hypothetical protein